MPKKFPSNSYNTNTKKFGDNNCYIPQGSPSDDGEVPTCSRYVSDISKRNAALANSSIRNYFPTVPTYSAQTSRSHSVTSTGVYITQLHLSISAYDLEEIFSTIGSISKCYVATNKETGRSLGYGIVHYLDSGSAEKAIQMYNGFIIKGQEIHVELYKNPKEREHEKPFTNLFIKNFQGGILSEDEFLSLFVQYGSIKSYKMERDPRTGEIKGYGYVCFDEPKNAKLAMQSLNGMLLKNCKNLFVGKHQNKQQLETKTTQQRIDILHNRGEFTPAVSSSPSVITTRISSPFREDFSSSFSCPVIPKNNIYVKNLKGIIDTNEALFSLFQRFGLIVSAVIMRDEITKVSRGFGFVCFKLVQNAATAISEMNNSLLPNGKILYCGYAQGKYERQAQLRLQFRQNVPAHRQTCIERRRRNGLSSSSTFLEKLCNICFEEKPPSESVLLDCKHVNCKDCLRDWFKILIKDKQMNMTCPGENCETPISPTLLKTLLTQEIFERYDKILLECALESMDDIVHCPFPGCDAWISIDPLFPTRGACDSCNLVFCTNCTDTYHGLDPCNEFVDEEEKERVITTYLNGTLDIKIRLEQRFGKSKLDKELETRMNNLFLKQNCKKCPKCKSNIEKNGGCNHMSCKCGTHFCWICLQVFAEKEAVVHTRASNCQPAV